MRWVSASACVLLHLLPSPLHVARVLQNRALRCALAPQAAQRRLGAAGLQRVLSVGLSLHPGSQAARQKATILQALLKLPFMRDLLGWARDSGCVAHLSSCEAEAREVQELSKSVRVSPDCVQIWLAAYVPVHGLPTMPVMLYCSNTGSTASSPTLRIHPFLHPVA